MAVSLPPTDEVIPATAGKTNLTYLIAISLTAALGGFLFGYDFSVISGGVHLIRQHFGVGDVGEGFLGASLYIGCIGGAVLAAGLSDRYGRRPVLAMAALFFGLSCVGTALAGSLNAFILFRLVGGLGVGVASIVSPLYIAEVAPGHLRGRMVAVNQLAIVVGILITYFSNYWLLRAFGGESWRWMLGVGLVPSALFLGLVLLIPESPRWLAGLGQTDRALAVLRRIGDDTYARAQWQGMAGLAQPTEQPRLRELFQPQMRLVLTIGLVLAVFQQWCGINNIFTYAPRIFAAAGLDDKEGLRQTVVIGVVNLLVTLLAMRLVDRVGRRKLLLFGSLGLCVLYTGLGYTFWSGQPNQTVLLVLLLACIGVYGVSLAPVTWVVNAEIFPNRLRGTGLSFVTLFLWVACFALIQTFPWLFNRLNGAYLFWFFAVVCGAGFGFIWRNVPETKGKSLEQIERELIGQ